MRGHERERGGNGEAGVKEMRQGPRRAELKRMELHWRERWGDMGRRESERVR